MECYDCAPADKIVHDDASPSWHAHDTRTANDDIVLFPSSLNVTGEIYNNISASAAVKCDYSDVGERTTSELFEDIIYRGPVVIICLLGLIGNTLNLVVLSRKSLTVTMERMERSAHYGLVGLAASDALLCSSVLPTVGVGSRVFGYRAFDFRILYVVYSEGVINTFILSSTWLTVSMAVSRYVAVCYPFQARLFIGKRFAVVSLLVVFVVCVLFNIPRYFRSEIDYIDCVEGGSFYFKIDGALTRNPPFLRAYQWVSFVAGIAVPFAVLAFCNVNLVIALRRSSTMRAKNCGVRPSGGSGNALRHNDDRAANRITLTMIVIVASYIFLVVPTETMTFVRDAVVEHVGYLDTYNLLLAVFNMFQAANFAFSFLLYCAINAHFRQTFCRLLSHSCCCCCCCGCRSGGDRGGGRGGLVRGGGCCHHDKLHLTTFDQRRHRHGTEDSVSFESNGGTYLHAVKTGHTNF